jgi:hypothetical protein
VPAESVPVTAEVLARALKTLPSQPWYEDVFKTLVGVIVGGVIALAASWWLKYLDYKARAENLKVAFFGEVEALRATLRVETSE